jgi:hypothetical protein
MVAVSMVTKSQAIAAWECRNSLQVTAVRLGAGSMPLALSIFHTVDGARWWPRPTSSPWIRRYPHVAFAVAISITNRRITTAVAGRPGRRGRWVQWRATRCRCQRNNVSGVTSQPVRVGRGSASATAASNDRSSSVTCGRSTLRLSTASWWRNTMISRSLARPDRTASRARPAIRRYRTRHTRRQARPRIP